MQTDEIIEDQDSNLMKTTSYNYIESIFDGNWQFKDIPHRLEFYEDGRLISNEERRKNQRIENGQELIRQTQKNKIEHCKLDNKAQLYAPIIDRQEENRGFIIKCFNWLDHEQTITNHFKTLFFFFLKVVIVVGGFSFIIYFYFFVKQLFV